MLALKKSSVSLESVFYSMNNACSHYSDCSKTCESKWINLYAVNLSNVYDANISITSNRSDNTYESFDCNYGEITFSLFSYESGEVIKDYSVKFNEENGEIDDEYEWNNDRDGGYGNTNYLPKDVKTMVCLLVRAFLNEKEIEELEEYEEFKEEVKETYLSPLSIAKLISSTRTVLKDRKSGSKRIVRRSGIYYSLTRSYIQNNSNRLTERFVIRVLNNRSNMVIIYENPIIKTGNDLTDKPEIYLHCRETVTKSFEIIKPESTYLDELLYLPYITDYAIFKCLGHNNYTSDIYFFRG